MRAISKNNSECLVGMGCPERYWEIWVKKSLGFGENIFPPKHSNLAVYIRQVISVCFGFLICEVGPIIVAASESIEDSMR